MKPPGSRDIPNDEMVAELFGDHFVALTRGVYLMVGDLSEAEDIVQEALERLLASRKNMRNLENAPGYFRTIAFNLARSRLRKRDVETRHQSELWTQSQERVLSNKAGQPESEAIDASQARSVALAVAGLPTRQRECVVLRFYMGLAEAEIATALGISSGSVKTHCSRAMEALSRSLGEQ